MADRPVECGQCRKTTSVIYKEIAGDVVTAVEMCSECPILQGRLYGISSEARGKVSNTEAGVCCGRCGTTLLAVRTGGLMGCSECYTVFEEAIASEMISTGKISNRMGKMQESSKKQTLHAGKTPDQKVELTPANRIVSLNEALKEALKKRTTSKLLGFGIKLRRSPMKELLELPIAILQHNPWSPKSNPVWPATIFQCKRNIGRSNFPGKLSSDELGRIFQLLKEQVIKFFGNERCQVFPADQLSAIDKEFVFEHFLCREAFQDAGVGQGFIIDTQGKFLGLLNIQDHLSLQWVDTADSWEETWSELAKLEEAIATQLAFAFSPMFGFLTANPHDCGTALSVSALMHIPTLFHLDALDPVLASLEGVEVTNLEGQKGKPLADYLFLKNHHTLGVSEEEILRSVHLAATKVVSAEKGLRAQILTEGNAEIKDLISRAYGLLIHSYQLNTKETLGALSLLKLGLDLGWVEGLNDQEINQLFLLTRRGHLLKTLGKKNGRAARTLSSQSLISSWATQRTPTQRSAFVGVI